MKTAGWDYAKQIILEYSLDFDGVIVEITSIHDKVERFTVEKFELPFFERQHTSWGEHGVLFVSGGEKYRFLSGSFVWKFPPEMASQVFHPIDLLLDIQMKHPAETAGIGDMAMKAET